MSRLIILYTGRRRPEWAILKYVWPVATSSPILLSKVKKKMRAHWALPKIESPTAPLRAIGLSQGLPREPQWLSREPNPTAVLRAVGSLWERERLSLSRSIF